jgi:hypothetical protein
MGDFDRFSHRLSLAGVLQPGDATRYEMVVSETWDTIEVVVLNDSFFDKITFLKHDGRLYKTFLGDQTNPWTIKAAEEMRDRFTNEMLKSEKAVVLKEFTNHKERHKILVDLVTEFVLNTHQSPSDASIHSLMDWSYTKTLDRDEENKSMNLSTANFIDWIRVAKNALMTMPKIEHIIDEKDKEEDTTDA